MERLAGWDSIEGRILMRPVWMKCTSILVVAAMLTSGSGLAVGLSCNDFRSRYYDIVEI
jgi:hypothetical protein